MAIKLDSKPVASQDIASKKLKVKFNACTMIVLDKDKFNSNELFEENGFCKFLPYPRVNTYKTFQYGQIAEIDQIIYDEQLKDRTVLINNERMGNLSEVLKERMATATPAEREFIEANKHEYTSCSFVKPICEIVM